MGAGAISRAGLHEEKFMKLSTKLGLVVGCAALGTVLIIVLALQNLRSSMLTDRQDQIRMVLSLARKQVGVFIA